MSSPTRHRASWLAGLACLLLTAGDAAAKPPPPEAFFCIEGSWKGLKAEGVEGLPAAERAELQRYAGSLYFRIREEEFGMGPRGGSSTGIDRLSGNEDWVEIELAVTKDFFGEKKRSFRLEPLGTERMRAYLVEGHPFLFKRVTELGPGRCGMPGRRSPLVPDLFGRWYFEGIKPIARGRKVPAEVSQELAGVSLVFEEDRMRVLGAGEDSWAAYRVLGASGAYESLGSTRRVGRTFATPVQRVGTEVTLKTQHPYFRGSPGDERWLILRLEGDRFEFLRGYDGVLMVLTFSRTPSRSPGPAAPAKAPARKSGSEIVECEVDGRTVFTRADRCY